MNNFKYNSGSYLGDARSNCSLSDAQFAVFAAIRKSQERVEKQNPTWVQYVNKEEYRNIKLRVLISALMADLSQDPTLVNLNLIQKINPEPRHLLAVLRTCFLHKEKVSGWQQLNDFTAEYLLQRDMDAPSIMKGLDAKFPETAPAMLLIE